MYMYVSCAFIADASCLVMVRTNSVSKITLADINRGPLIVNNFGVNIIAILVFIKTYWELMNMIQIFCAASSDPVAGLSICHDCLLII